MWAGTKAAEEAAASSRRRRRRSTGGDGDGDGDGDGVTGRRARRRGMARLLLGLGSMGAVRTFLTFAYSEGAERARRRRRVEDRRRERGR